MARWRPDGEGRLRDAALDLFAERGFDETTVANIAERAGLTARTFFNHFADKRDVLFAGSARLQAEMEGALDAAPSSASAIDAVMAALAAGAAVVSHDRTYSSRRREVILANVQLLERELLKLETLTTALTEGLRHRGVADDDARLAAEVGITVFKVAFDLWATGSDDADMPTVMGEVLARLRQVSADPSPD